MQINCKQMFEVEGDKLPIECRLTLQNLDLWGAQPFAMPVGITGSIQNRAGIVTLCYTADFMLLASCDRCACKLQIPKRETFSHTLMRSTNTDDGYGDDCLIIPDGMLELDELVIADILLDMPSKILCSEDCKGLCPDCGANRNEGACSCAENRIDPRLTQLAQFISPDES